MADTKYPIIRYQTLDKCFRNKYKRYYIEDLIDACSEAIYNHCGEEKGCSRRTILNDIDYMESEAGWCIPLERHQDGRRVWYRYRNTNFTINKTLLSEDEYNKINEAVLMLDRFKGLPCFEWIDDILIKLNSGLKKSATTILEFENSISPKGSEHIDRLFNAILYKQTLIIKYRTFADVTHEWTIHPYLIKQYNGRWFLFGRNDSKGGSISNLPLDRIVDITDSSARYIEDDGNVQKLFDALIGVTMPPDAVAEDIVLKFSERRYPYVLTKPIHKSQKTLSNEECTIQITVIPNKELESYILQFGSDVEVLSPQTLRSQIKEKIQEMTSKY